MIVILFRLWEGVKLANEAQKYSKVNMLIVLYSTGTDGSDDTGLMIIFSELLTAIGN